MTGAPESSRPNTPPDRVVRRTQLKAVDVRAPVWSPPVTVDNPPRPEGGGNRRPWPPLNTVGDSVIKADVGSPSLCSADEVRDQLFVVARLLHLSTVESGLAGSVRTANTLASSYVQRRLPYDQAFRYPIASKQTNKWRDTGKVTAQQFELGSSNLSCAVLVTRGYGEVVFVKAPCGLPATELGG